MYASDVVFDSLDSLNLGLIFFTISSQIRAIFGLKK
ncbi:uncharacterized protein METZ01_LOCUS466001 [marine metagenome]|uniref:Uncharacterized protein n=1 Tax=marine metagenome TaxID=408172 RepID=A0A383AZ87_9ZZZZ